MRETNGDLVVSFSQSLFLPKFTSDGFIITYDILGIAEGGTVFVAAQQAGPFNISEGQVTTIETPVSGVTGVLNFEDFVPGRFGRNRCGTKKKVV